MVNPKDKGNTNELRVYRWFKEMGVPAACIRASGNLFDESGDLIVDGRFCLECKHHKAVMPAESRAWWLKICNEAKTMRMEPMLQIRENNRPDRWRLLYPGQTDPELWMEIPSQTLLLLLNRRNITPEMPEQGGNEDGRDSEDQTSTAL